VIRAERVHDDFNPIGGARSKCYRYTIEHTSHPHHPRPLFDRNQVWATPYTLDLARMQDAARRLVGTYDCASFAQVDHGRSSTVRTVLDCVARAPSARRIEIEVAATGFLYNMVRILAGTLVEVGRGRIDAGDIPAIIEARDRTRAGPTLPPQGLCLRWIWYGAPPVVPATIHEDVGTPRRSEGEE
jgi:tRNA pseudouridine38-40 synthase